MIGWAQTLGSGGVLQRLFSLSVRTYYDFSSTMNNLSLCTFTQKGVTVQRGLLPGIHAYDAALSLLVALIRAGQEVEQKAPR